jgi:putative cardiolipin synthase
MKMMTVNSTLVDSNCTGSRATLCLRQPSHGIGRGSAVLKSCCLLLLTLVFLAGCATVPQDYPRTESAAFQDYLDTSVGQLFEETAVQHPGESGFALMRYGRPAFTARIALADLAEKTLDAQYYIWEADATGRILAERLIQAADRGVRVRLLVDDINLAGRDDNVAAMDAHPNIEIRIFNPFAHRKARVFDFLTDLGRINHRMHNKVMVMDNAVAIVGGRNIGNDYFGVATDANYRDLDIAAAGPVVREISNVFDYFWNGDWAVPIAALVDRPFTEADLRNARQTLHDLIANHAYPYPLDQDVAALESELRSMRDQFIWAPGQIVWDDPAAISQGIKEGSVNKAFHKKIPTLQRELLMESAYFVPRDRAVEIAKKLTERGVRIRVLTNSLASNDVIAAHAGHAKRRDELIAAGVEVYEYRPDSRIGKTRAWRGESKAALHTKAIVFDRESVFIGSFNLDPRSSDINTEAGLYVESPELAEQLVAYMDEGVRPENSYRVLLDEDGDLYWVTEVDGAEVRYDKDPESTFWQRFEAGFIMILPVEQQL